MWAERTDRRKPSVAAIMTRLPSKLVNTPVSDGRESSVAAAKATWEMTRFSTAGSMRTRPSWSGSGMTGNSSASMPLMLACTLPQETWSVSVVLLSDRSTRSEGRLLISSPKVRAGTVVAPLSCTVAPIQQVMTISRLVAESFRRPLSTASSTLPNTGSVDRGLTARPTMLNPLARLSCRQEIFMTTRSS